MDDVDLDALASDLGFVLETEQKEAVESLFRGKDDFGVLPTDFGKSLIFQLPGKGVVSKETMVLRRWQYCKIIWFYPLG